MPVARELHKPGHESGAYRQNTKREILRYRIINIAVGSKVSVERRRRAGLLRAPHAGSQPAGTRQPHLLGHPEGADAATTQEKEKQALLLLRRAQSGEDFSRLAREYSEDTATRAEGWRSGLVRQGHPAQAHRGIGFLHEGRRNPRGRCAPIAGFHVIKLLGPSRAGPPSPCLKWRDQIRGQLRQREMERQTKNFLTELRRGYWSTLGCKPCPIFPAPHLAAPSA